MHFEIYVPESDQVPPGCAPKIGLPAVGLDFLLDRATAAVADDGPDGNAGTIYSWAAPRGWDPHTMTATPAVQRGDLEPDRYHILTVDDALPTPDQLQRPYVYEGDWVDFGGSLWLVPRAEQLPADAVFRDDGSVRFITQRRFSAWVVRCERTLQETLRAGEWDVGLAVETLVEALQLNYRIPLELTTNVLRLFNTHNVEEPFLRAIGGAHLASLVQRGA